jgi:hypothetical protein
MAIECSIKGAARLTLSQFKTLERCQLSQLSVQLAEAAEIDLELARRAERFENERKLAQVQRHMFVHAVWGENPDGREVVAIDARRNQTLGVHDLERACLALAKLTISARGCLERVADLICDGSLPGGIDEPGKVAMRWRDRLVIF